MSDADAGARSEDLAVSGGIALHDRDFLAVADVDGRGDALVQHHLAPIPGVIDLGVPETGEDVFSLRVDDLSTGRNHHLSRPADRGDAIALDDDHGVGHRRATISIDQSTSLDDQRRRRALGNDRAWRCPRQGKAGGDRKSQRQSVHGKPSQAAAGARSPIDPSLSYWHSSGNEGLTFRGAFGDNVRERHRDKFCAGESKGCGGMLLLIDNYDSFTYNLFHFLGELGQEVLVKRTDKISVA